MTGSFGPLVSTQWLADNLSTPDVRILDGSFYLPAEKRDPRAEYAAAHIPGSQFFDIDEICDKSIALPHMFPDAALFADRVGKLGIANGNRIVCYDGGKMTGAGRVWWMFRAFGHENVAILDGGYRKWAAEGRAAESGRSTPAPAKFEARFDRDKVRSIDDVRRILDSAEAQVLDARSAGRYSGSEPEPRAGMRSGHMPNALNLPYDRLINGNGTLKSAAELEAAFAAAGVDSSRPVVTSCGSGVSATVLLLGLHLLGRDGLSLYDGSWSEWGSRQDTPVVT